MNKLSTYLPLVLLGLVLGCGGGSKNSTPAPPKTAVALAYTDPTTGTYQLKRNASLSTPATHLVLELWGPATVSGCGATVSLALDTAKASWTNVAPTDAANTYVTAGTVFDLGSTTPILKAKVTAATLAATVAEKGLASPKALNGALLRFALDLKSGLALTTGTAVSLTPDAAKCQVLLGDGTLVTIPVTVGSLTAQ